MSFRFFGLFFEALRITWLIWQSIFDHFWILLTWFLNNFSQEQWHDLLWYGQIITVKTVTLCKKLYFYHEKSKEHEKEADPNFVLLSKSMNMIQ